MTGRSWAGFQAELYLCGSCFFRKKKFLKRDSKSAAACLCEPVGVFSWLIIVSEAVSVFLKVFVSSGQGFVGLLPGSPQR